MATPLSDLRKRAASGEILTLDEVREFVAASRKSYTARLADVPEDKNTEKSAHAPKLSRVKKAPPPEDVNFF